MRRVRRNGTRSIVCAVGHGTKQSSSYNRGVTGQKNGFQRDTSSYNHLQREENNPEDFEDCREIFDHLLNVVKPYITKQTPS
jgi:hypothetical protein